MAGRGLDDRVPERLIRLLRCPETGAALEREGSRVVTADGAGFAIRDGVVDFMGAGPGDAGAGDANRRVEAAYDAIAGAQYDGTIGLAWWWRLAWGAHPRRGVDPVAELRAVPRGGVVLDVPVGTGIFTAGLVAARPDLAFLGVDTSMGMLRAARARFDAGGAANVLLLRADAARLPVRDGCADACLSLLGLHVIPAAREAAAEMARCLAPSGVLTATMLLGGRRRLTDLLHRVWLIRHGVITRLYTEDAYREIFDAAGLSAQRFANDGALLTVRARKPAPPLGSGSA